MNDIVRIVVGSDICPTPDNQMFFTEGRVDALLPPEFLSLFRSADFSILNVECPLTNAASPIPKMGPALKAPPACINFYAALGITAACFANNHILDYGEQGVEDTLAGFAMAGIRAVGAGMDLDQARTPLVQEFPGGRSLAVVAMAESEFCIAGKSSAGANPIDFANYTRVGKLKEQHDKVLVILHGGTEMRQLPRPGLIDLCHFLVDQGADAVLVQHTHCVGGVEHYHDGLIVYGQGNFIFGKLHAAERKPAIWWEGMQVELAWNVKNNDWTLQLHPFLQRPDDVRLRLLSAAEEEAFYRQLERFATLMKDRDEIESSWQEFCADSRDSVLLNLMGASRIPRALAFRGLPLVKLWLWLINFRLLQNMISCQSHRELALDVLKSLPGCSAVARPPKGIK